MMNQPFALTKERIRPMTKRTGAIVEFKEVTKKYGPLTVLKPTSLTIEPGEFFAIIGPSGSGKSTLLGITAGFVPPTGGEVHVDGADLSSVPPYHRNLGMVFQNYALFPHMTVAENIGFPLRMRRISKADIKAKVERVLDMVRLDGLGGRRPAELSGGQQQRVALARAAVYDPLLLLMDEPLGALDKNLREEMQEEIKSFQHQLGCTVIYVTHDQHEAAFMADRIAIMRNGRLEQIGSPRELYEKPDSVFVASFLGEATLLPVSSIERNSAKGETRALLEGDIAVLSTGLDRPGAQDGSLCVRPENIRIGKMLDGLDNIFTATLEDRVYTTGSVRYRVRLDASPHLLTIRVPSHPGIVLLDPGQRVMVGWNASDALLVNGN